VANVAPPSNIDEAGTEPNITTSPQPPILLRKLPFFQFFVYVASFCHSSYSYHYSPHCIIDYLFIINGIMAALLVLSAIAVIVLYHIVSSYRGLVRNIALAKSSGLRVVILPVNVFSVLWLATNPLWLPLLAKLPESWKGIWFE
jgi:hypothetical protein